jgi:Transposase DDE domain
MENATLERDSDWELLLRQFPDGWETQAHLTGAIERFRRFRSVEDLLRTLLLHVGLGYSLRETAVRATQTGLARVSDVAVLDRMRKAGAWFRWICNRLLEEKRWELPEPGGWKVRILDGTLVKGPGAGGRSWRIHYSLIVPGLECDYLELTSAKGKHTGEVLNRFPARPGELILADRGFAKPPGVEALVRQGAALIVRLNTGSLPLYTARGQRFGLLEAVQQITEPDQPAEWQVSVHGPNRRVAGRLCVIRKSAEAIARAQRRIRRKSQGGPQPKPETLVFAAYIMVFTTLPKAEFSTAEVLEWYRGRWQIELAFKRLKSLAKLGHLHDQSAETVRAWLYGKLCVALLAQKLMRVEGAISPWGYRQGASAHLLERI